MATTMSIRNHIETVQAYLDMLIFITASEDVESAMPGVVKVLFQIGEHVKAIEDQSRE